MAHVTLRRIGYSIMVLSSVVIIVVNLPRLGEILRGLLENWVPVQSIASLIRNTVIAGGILLFLGVILTSYWVWAQGREWRCVQWNPPNPEEIRQEIRYEERNGMLSAVEADSLHSAIDGLDGTDLELLRLLDKRASAPSFGPGSSHTHSFEGMATKLSENISDIDGEMTCVGKLQKLESNGLIRAEGAWATGSEYTTQLGQQITRIVQEVKE